MRQRQAYVQTNAAPTLPGPRGRPTTTGGRRGREREMPRSDSGIDTIDEVVEALDTIIAGALDEGIRVGYFAAVYRKVTAKIAEGIATGFFDDGERMQRLDVTFADRYLSALSRHRTVGMATKSWELALQATAASRPIILRHVLVGINAHINLDLGIAAARRLHTPSGHVDSGFEVVYSRVVKASRM